MLDFPLLFLSAVIAGVRHPSWMLWASIAFNTSNNIRRAIAQTISAINNVLLIIPTLISFMITSVISPLMVEIIIFAPIPRSYSLTVAKTVEANVRNFFAFCAILILCHLCYTADAAAMSFLHSSCSHLQVQTVPSSAWDAPCPVVTPSCFCRLGSALSVYSCEEFYFTEFQPYRTRGFCRTYCSP